MINNSIACESDLSNKNMKFLEKDDDSQITAAETKAKEFKPESEMQGPSDRYNYAYFVFLLLGIVMILPWNALIQSLGFLDANLPGKDISFVVSTIANAPIFIAQVLLIKFYKFFNSKLVAVISLCAIASLCIVIPIITEYINNVTLLWIIILIVLAVFCTASGFLQSAGFGYAGPFPPRIIGSLSTGCGLSGVIIGICRAISLASFPTENNVPDDPNLYKGTLLYFILASFCCVVCLVLFLIMLKTPYNRFYGSLGKDVATDRQSSVILAISFENGNPLNHSEKVKENGTHTTDALLDGPVHQEPSVLKIHNKYWMIFWGITFNFVIVFCLYPGLFLQATLHFIRDDDWRTWFVIFLFTVCDTAGRFMSGVYVIKSPKLNMILTLCRLVFFATTFLCIYDISIFSSDIVKVANIVLTAATCGYIVNCQMIIGCTLPEPYERETSGKMLNFSLVFGILIGSLAATFGFSRLF